MLDAKNSCRPPATDDSCRWSGIVQHQQANRVQLYNSFKMCRMVPSARIPLNLHTRFADVLLTATTQTGFSPHGLYHLVGAGDRLNVAMLSVARLVALLL